MRKITTSLGVLGLVLLGAATAQASPAHASRHVMAHHQRLAVASTLDEREWAPPMVQTNDPTYFDLATHTGE